MIDDEFIAEQQRLLREAASKPDPLTPEQRRNWQRKVASAHGLDEHGRPLADDADLQD